MKATKLAWVSLWVCLLAQPLLAFQQTSAPGVTSEAVGDGTLDELLESRPPTSLDDFKVLEQHIKTIQESIRPATVALSSGGSGVVVSADGYILTCAHVNQRPGRVVTATFPDGRQVKAITLGNNHGIDAGLIKITEAGTYPYVQMGSSSGLKPGQWCMAVGYPVSFNRGQQPAIRLGRVLVCKPRMIVTDCTIMGGDSGGPLFDLRGRVVGISSRVNNSIDTNIHVPVDTYQESWERLTASLDWSDEDQRSYLGITRDTEREQVVIKAIKPNSPAEKSGLQVGDKIVAFDKSRINTFEDLLAKMETRRPQDRVQLTILRDQQSLNLVVQLDYWPTSEQE